MPTTMAVQRRRSPGRGGGKPDECEGRYRAGIDSVRCRRRTDGPGGRDGKLEPTPEDGKKPGMS